jgi:hypothetical protein
MKLEALRSFGLKGEAVQIGEVVEVSPSDARQLINSGQAKEAVVCEVQKTEPKPKAKKTPKPKTTPTPEESEE